MATVYSPFISELREKMEFEGAFLVKIIQLHMDKNGRPYLNLILMDKTGEVEARAWENAAKLAEEVHKAVAGRAMQAELTALGLALENPKRPVAAIVGGAANKLSDPRRGRAFWIATTDCAAKVCIRSMVDCGKAPGSRRRTTSAPMT